MVEVDALSTLAAHRRDLAAQQDACRDAGLSCRWRNDTVSLWRADLPCGTVVVTISHGIGRRSELVATHRTGCQRTARVADAEDLRGWLAAAFDLCSRPRVAAGVDS